MAFHFGSKSEVIDSPVYYLEFNSTCVDSSCLQFTVLIKINAAGYHRKRHGYDK